jgi:hypothetical protein
MNWIYTVLPILSVAGAIAAILLGFLTTLTNLRRLKIEKERLERDKVILIAISNLEIETRTTSKHAELTRLITKHLDSITEGVLSRETLPDLRQEVLTNLTAIKELRAMLEGLRSKIPDSDDQVLRNVGSYCDTQIANVQSMEKEIEALLARVDTLTPVDAETNNANSD